MVSVEVKELTDRSLELMREIDEVTRFDFAPAAGRLFDLMERSHDPELVASDVDEYSRTTGGAPYFRTVVSTPGHSDDCWGHEPGDTPYVTCGMATLDPPLRTHTRITRDGHTVTNTTVFAAHGQEYLVLSEMAEQLDLDLDDSYDRLQFVARPTDDPHADRYAWIPWWVELH